MLRIKAEHQIVKDRASPPKKTSEDEKLFVTMIFWNQYLVCAKWNSVCSDSWRLSFFSRSHWVVGYVTSHLSSIFGSAFQYCWDWRRQCLFHSSRPRSYPKKFREELSSQCSGCSAQVPPNPYSKLCSWCENMKQKAVPCLGNSFWCSTFQFSWFYFCCSPSAGSMYGWEPESGKILNSIEFESWFTNRRQLKHGFVFSVCSCSIICAFVNLKTRIACDSIRFSWFGGYHWPTICRWLSFWANKIHWCQKRNRLSKLRGGMPTMQSNQFYLLASGWALETGKSRPEKPVAHPKKKDLGSMAIPEFWKIWMAWSQFWNRVV